MKRLLYCFSLLFAPVWASEHTGARHFAAIQLRGIDVSHHQKMIEWDTVAQHNTVDFAFVKATEGHDFRDSLFCRNWYELRRLGIRRGAYHFFRAYGCGYDQAINFLSTVDMEPGDLAPVLDIETTDNMPAEAWLEEARIWLYLVEQHLGVRPIIYTNQRFYERFLAGALDDYPLWVARYADELPELPGDRDWHFWQYTNQGCINGIESHVDLNVFSGPPAKLDELSWQPRAPESEDAKP